MGEDKTLTVQVRTDLKVTTVDMEVDPEGVIAIVGENKVALTAHKKRPTEILVGQIRVRPLVEDKETLVSVNCGCLSAVALVEVRPERMEVEVPGPETLQFERDSYRAAYGKKKTVRVLAPVELVDKLGKYVRVTSSDPGVVVLAGGKSGALVKYFVSERFRAVSKPPWRLAVGMPLSMRGGSGLRG